jgi:peptidoglycan/LPS O-acetylase OafA/YrhL
MASKKDDNEMVIDRLVMRSLLFTILGEFEQAWTELAVKADHSPGRQSAEFRMNLLIEEATRKPSGWAQLDTVRLVLSSAVVISHANFIFITPLGYVALFPFLQWGAKLAVLAFFVLSGLVIGRALNLKRDGLFSFMVRRVGRIYPPLIASFILVIALDAWLRFAGISTQAPSDAGPMVNGYTYDLNRAALCLATFGFRGNLESASNAALWSLAIEMRCYVVAGLFAQMMFARSLFIRALSAAALLYVLNELLWQNPLDRLTALSYFAFGCGIALSLFVKRIPSVIPAVPVDISYSLFIFHFPIMLAMFFMFYQPEFPSIWQALCVSIISIMVSVALSLASALSIEKLRFQLNIRPARASNAADVLKAGRNKPSYE